MTSKSLVAAVVLAMLAAACGGGDDDRNYRDPINNPSAASQAQAAVSAAASLSTLESDPTSSDAVSKMSQLYAASSVLLSAKLAASAGAQKPVATPLEALRAAASLGKPFDASCITATSSRVTYASCDLDGAGTINGSVSWGGGSFTMDLAMSIASQGTSFTVTEKGTVSVSTAAIAGDIDVTAKGSVAGYSYDYSISTNYDVALSGSLATAGEMEVHGRWSVKGPQSASYDLWVKAEFNGNTVTLY